MKKFIVLIFTFLIILSSSLSVFAADTIYAVIYGFEPQDALLVGKATKITDDYIEIEVIRTVVGTPAESPFKVYKTKPSHHTMDSATLETPYDFSVDDGILVSVEFSFASRSSGNLIFGIYKVDLMPDKKIKMNVNDRDVDFIEWGVNVGADENLGKSVKNIYNGESWNLDSLDSKFKAPEVINTSVISYRVLCILLFIVLPIIIIFLITAIVFIFKRRRKKLILHR